LKKTTSIERRFFYHFEASFIKFKVLYDDFDLKYLVKKAGGRRKADDRIVWMNFLVVCQGQDHERDPNQKEKRSILISSFSFLSFCKRKQVIQFLTTFVSLVAQPDGQIELGLDASKKEDDN
jgi:hypothetical protein